MKMFKSMMEVDGNKIYTVRIDRKLYNIKVSKSGELLSIDNYKSTKNLKIDIEFGVGDNND